MTTNFNVKLELIQHVVQPVEAETPEAARAAAETSLRGRPGVQRVSVLSVMPAVELAPAERAPVPIDPKALEAALAAKARIPGIVETEWPKALDGLPAIFERWNVRDRQMGYVGDDMVTACAARSAALLAAISNFMQERLPGPARAFASQLISRDGRRL